MNLPYLAPSEFGVLCFSLGIVVSQCNGIVTDALWLRAVPIRNPKNKQKRRLLFGMLCRISVRLNCFLKNRKRLVQVIFECVTICDLWPKSDKICFRTDALRCSLPDWRDHRIDPKTTDALRCSVPVWRDHTIGPKTVKNGDNHSTAPKRNMGRSARGNLVQWVNL